MPATCVPWNDTAGSTASLPGAPEFGPGNARATITFGEVHLRAPRGKPGGYEKPVGEKNVFVWSIPSSTTAIFTPVPSAPAVLRRTSAPITDGEWSSASVYATLG